MTLQRPEELDLERIAAYIDNRLSQRERDEVEEILASSDEAREVFAEALRVRQDMGWTDHGPNGERSSRTSRFRRPFMALVPLAAAAALVLAWSSSRTLNDSAAGAGSGAITFLSEVDNERAWTQRRGGEELLSEEEVAFRAGATWSAFELSWRAGLSTTEQRRAELLTILEYAPIAASIEAVRSVPTIEERRGPEDGLELANATLVRLLVQPAYSWGVALERLRLATAAVGNGTDPNAQSARRYLAGPASEELPEEQSIREFPNAAQQALRAVVALVVMPELDQQALATAIDRAMALLGG